VLMPTHAYVARHHDRCTEAEPAQGGLLIETAPSIFVDHADDAEGKRLVLDSASVSSAAASSVDRHLAGG